MTPNIAIIPQAVNELVLRIAGGRPLQASELGDLFLALARDYRQMNRGRTLVVTRIEAGSILIFLQDALLAAKPYLSDTLEFAKGGKALVDFAKSIKDLVGKKKAPDVDSVEGSKQGPYRTIEAVLKIAAEKECEISIKYVGGKEEGMEVHLTPKDALEIREKARFAGRQAKISHAELLLERTAPPRLMAERARELADEIERIALPSANDTSALLSIVIRLLRSSGNEHLVEMLALELADRGYSDVAVAVRAAGAAIQENHVHVTR